MVANEKTPLFVIGPPRSGTTILTQVLNSSESIIITDELRVNAWLVREILRINAGHEVYGDPYPFNKGNRFAIYLQSQGSFFLLKFYEKLAAEEGKDSFIYWGDKYPHYDRYLKKFPRIFPKAMYIAIFRNISEVINSVMVGHGWDFQKSIEYCKKIYKNYLEQMELLNYERIFVFDYSTLKSENPLDEIEKMFSFLNLDLEQTQENKIKTILSYQSHSTRKPDTIGKKFSSNYTKNSLSEKNLQTIKSDEDISKLNEEIYRKYSIKII